MLKTITAALSVFGVTADIQSTPAMGYIAATNHHCWVQSGVLKLQADYMAHLGLDKKGYNHFIVDDCW